jgi:glycosyltransferase involved in cell wall biosynthesis
MNEKAATFRDAASGLPHPPTVHSDSWMDPDCQEGLASVVLPTYNRAHFLPDAIGSVIDQTYRPVELLVVDDGSTDDTREVVEELADRSDAELTIRFLSQSKQGAPAARNLGLLNSRGEFIQFLDSDDIMHPQKLEAQIRILRSYSEAEYVWADFHWARDQDFALFDSSHQGEYDVPSLVEKTNLDSGSAVEAWTGLYRRSACCRVGPWNETLERWQDLEYNFRFDCTMPTSAWTDAKLYKNRGHDDGRIMDARFAVDGIRKGLHTLDVIEETAEQIDAESLPVDVNLRGRYFQLARKALEFGTKDQVETALQKAIENSDPGFDTKMLQFLQAIYLLTGQKVAWHLLKAYSKIRSRC